MKAEFEREGGEAGGWTVGFSGHRKLAEAGRLAVRVGEGWREMAAMFPGAGCGVVSAADGGDLVFGREVRRAGGRLHLILPGTRGEFGEEISAGWRAEYEAAMAEAATVEELVKGEKREEDYYECGLAVLGACGVLMAGWNGAPAAGKGGTGDMVALAREWGMPLYWVQAETGEVVKENWPDVRGGVEGWAEFWAGVEGRKPAVVREAGARRRRDWVAGFGGKSGGRGQDGGFL